MKISTLALGALISFSVNTFAQENPKTVSEVKHTKTQKKKKQNKCSLTKSEMAATDSLLIDKPRKNRVCEACGRG